MDRRKTLAAVGAISLTASAAFVALGSSVGLFGLTETSPRVGKLSPIDTTQPATKTRTVYVDDVVPVPTPTAGGTGSGSGTSAGSRTHATASSSTAGHQSGSNDQVVTSPSGPSTAPTASVDPPGNDSHRDASEVERGSSGSGHVGDDD